MEALVESNPNAENITIYEIGYVNPSEAVQNLKVSEPDNAIRSLGLTVIGPVVKNYTSRDDFESDRWMASCARGETKTVQNAITQTLKSTVTGDMTWGSLGIENQLTCVITVGQTLTGPPESGSANSREYRCKFYQNTGTWFQSRIINGLALHGSGSFIEPSKYISYSVDKRY